MVNFNYSFFERVSIYLDILQVKEHNGQPSAASTFKVWLPLSLDLIRSVSPIIDWYVKASFNVSCGVELEEKSFVTLQQVKVQNTSVD